MKKLEMFKLKWEKEIEDLNDPKFNPVTLEEALLALDRFEDNPVGYQEDTIDSLLTSWPDEVITELTQLIKDQRIPRLLKEVGNWGLSDIPDKLNLEFKLNLRLIAIGDEPEVVTLIMDHENSVYPFESEKDETEFYGILSLISKKIGGDLTPTLKSRSWLEGERVYRAFDIRIHYGS